MDLIGIVWLFPVLMALAALVNGLGCRKLGKTAGHISWIAMACTFVLAVGIFFQVKDLAHPHGDGHEFHDVPASLEKSDAVAWRWNKAGEKKHADEIRQSILDEYRFTRVTDIASAKDAGSLPWHTDVREGQGGHVSLWEWISIPAGSVGNAKDLKVEMAFHVDQLTAIFLLFISFVGTLVFIYATGYMKEEHHGHLELDPGYARFFSYLALFAASMYTLILGANFVVMFIGWEGVGLCSYLLIGYYFDKPFSEKLSCADAGKKAFVVNRVGDFGLMLGMFLIFWGLGTLDFQAVIHRFSAGDVPEGFQFTGTTITIACLLLFLGATGKSAQIPLFTWLPDAMAGPTPVSALIHAATMVTAGVYMLARLNVLYMMAPAAMGVVAVVGAATAFIAAYAGLTQRGIKKILAYSTVSQLGFMFLAMGVGAFAAGIFHVFTHAFFKACLFLAAGSIIHALHHEEDVFKMGGLRKKMPLTWIAYLLATLAIAGIFPFAGFWSKDEILYMTRFAGQGSGSYLYIALWVVGLVTAGMTAFYMGRSLFLAFHGKTRMDHHHYDHVHESPRNITGVILVLGIASVFVGLLNVPKGMTDWTLKLVPTEMFHHFIAPVTDRGALRIGQDLYGWEEGHAPYGALIIGDVVNESTGALDTKRKPNESGLALVSVLIGLGGLGLAFLLYGAGSLKRSESLAKSPGLASLWGLSWNVWHWDSFYNEVFVKRAMRMYEAVLWFDKQIIDGIVNGAGEVCQWFARELRKLQNGQVQIYGLVMFIGVCLFLVYFMFGLADFIQVRPSDNQRPTPPAARPAARVSIQPAALSQADWSGAQPVTVAAVDDSQ